MSNRHFTQSYTVACFRSVAISCTIASVSIGCYEKFYLCRKSYRYYVTARVQYALCTRCISGVVYYKPRVQLRSFRFKKNRHSIRELTEYLTTSNFIKYCIFVVGYQQKKKKKEVERRIRFRNHRVNRKIRILFGKKKKMLTYEKTYLRSHYDH